MNCVGFGNRKRHKGEWTCPACIKATMEIADTEEKEDEVWGIHFLTQ